MGRVFRTLVIIVVFAGLAGAGLWFAGLRLAPLELRRFDPEAAIARAADYDGEITRDKWGVPRVIGTRDADAAFAFAYAHAEDDFPAVQGALRQALGREMLAANQDEAAGAYLVQALGISMLTLNHYEEQISAETRAYMEGFADGLNYYAALHPEERLPDLFPVTGRDVAALSALTSPLFYGMSGVLSRLLNPDESRDVSRGQEIQVLFTDPPGPATSTGIGSNAIAVAPSRSADGATRVIINSHQPVEGPLSWYEGHMVSREGLEFAGGAFPGGPFLHLGGNAHFAQAATVNRPDLIDVYELTLTENGEGYVIGDRWERFETYDARMLVHLFGPFAWEVTRPIERSAHGPVLRTPAGAYALRYATMDDLSAVEQTHLMMRATSLEEFDAAMRMKAIGATNRVAGDKTGRIARYYNARMPKRPDVEGIDWSGTLPGDRFDLIWSAFEPFDALPHMIDPEAGYVLDSNHSPFRVTLGPEDPRKEDYPERFGIEDNLTNRARRSTRLFAEDPDGLTSRDELLGVKYDTRYDPEALAMELKDALLAMDWSGEPELAPALEIIRAWDGAADKDNPHAALSLMTYQPIGTARFLGAPEPDLAETFREAVATLQTHHGRLDPPWSTVNRLKRGGESVGLAGGPDTLRAVSSTPEEDGTLRMVAGDGLTMLWEALPDGTTKLWAVHQFGASNRPDSPHYTDQMAMFADQTFREIPLGEEAIRAAAVRIYRPGEE